MQIGDRMAWERTFTEEDVQLFGQLSGDQGIQHMVPDEQGRLMVQGLLTATLPTKLGGDMNYLAREMIFDFIHPVFVGDTIRCEITITHLALREGRTDMSAALVCLNQRGKAVLTGHINGLIPIPGYNLVGLN